MNRPTEGQTDIACHSRVQRSVTSGPPVKTNLGDDVRDVKATKRRVYGELIQMLNEAHPRKIFRVNIYGIASFWIGHPLFS